MCICNINNPIRFCNLCEHMQYPMKLDPVIEKNRQLLHDRSQFGIKKYGTTLAEGNYSEEAILQHALEEALDLANYLQTRLMKIRGEL